MKFQIMAGFALITAAGGALERKTTCGSSKLAGAGINIGMLRW